MGDFPFGDWNLFLLVAVRVLALIEVAPLLSSDAVPQVANSWGITVCHLSAGNTTGNR